MIAHSFLLNIAEHENVSANNYELLAFSYFHIYKQRFFFLAEYEKKFSQPLSFMQTMKQVSVTITEDKNSEQKNDSPPLSCRGQITLSKTDKICPLAKRNQVSLISMHVPSLVKIP